MSYFTYQKGDHYHAKFNKSNHDVYDSLGKKYLIEFFEYFGWKTESFDRDENGNIDYNRPDMRCFRENSNDIIIEASIKNHELWKYTSPDIDIESRRLKYFKSYKDAFLFLAKSDGSEHYVIPMWLLDVAQQTSGSEYFGHRGRIKSVKTSPNFKYPEHGCFRVRKWCQKNGNFIEDDFYRIPRKYVFHYSKTVEQERTSYCLLRSPDFTSLEEKESERCLRCQMKFLGC